MQYMDDKGRVSDPAPMSELTRNTIWLQMLVILGYAWFILTIFMLIFIARHDLFTHFVNSCL